MNGHNGVAEQRDAPAGTPDQEPEGLELPFPATARRAGRMAWGPVAPGAPAAPPAAPPEVARTSARGFRGAAPVVVLVSDTAPAASAPRLATRAAVPGASVGTSRVRVVWAFPVLAVVVVVLTWVDVGVLRADDDEPDAAPESPASAPTDAAAPARNE